VRSSSSIARPSAGSRVAADDTALRGRLRKLSKDRPRWGYRRAHAQLIEEGRSINRKRVQRLWREEGLRVPQRRRRLGESTVPAERVLRSAPITCGRLTSSSIRPRTGGP
jgi:putative transposase